MSATDHLMPKLRRSYTQSAVVLLLVVLVHVAGYFAWSRWVKIVIPRFPPIMVTMVPDEQGVPKAPVKVTPPRAP